MDTTTAKGVRTLKDLKPGDKVLLASLNSSYIEISEVLVNIPAPVGINQSLIKVGINSNTDWVAIRGNDYCSVTSNEHFTLWIDPKEGLDHYWNKVTYIFTKMPDEEVLERATKLLQLYETL